MKDSIKREQSQASLSFAERKNFRPKVKKNKLLLLLVLLLTAVTGAWADGQELKVKIISEEMATPWLLADGSTMLATKDLPDFYPVTEDEAMAWADVPQEGTVFLIYAFDDPDEGSAVHYVRFDNGECTGSDQQDVSIYSIAYSITDQGVKFYYTYAFSAKLAANTKDAKNWTIASGENSVAGNVEAGLTGLSEGDAVTLTYTGHLKLKGIKAATDAAPAGNIVDLSTYSGDSYEVTEDVTFTGTTNNEISIVYGDGHEVTLDNVNAPKCRIVAQDDSYTINVKLKGTSRLGGIYNVNAYIIIGEAEAGGTVILVDEYTPLGGTGATITINGGTVKAKTSSYAAALDSILEVNGGAVYLEAAEDNPAVAISASGSVTLYGWNGSAWETYSNHRYLSTDNSKAPSEWTW